MPERVLDITQISSTGGLCDSTPVYGANRNAPNGAVTIAPMSTAIYARISSDRFGDELGVRRQERETRQLAERLGWEVGEVFVDDDRSAYSGKPRPAYIAMLAAIKRGDVTAVVAWHPDRLHRSPRELEDFITLLDATGCRVATVQAGEYDLSTPSGRMTARVVGAVSRHESEHKSERLKAKHRELAEAGKPAGGGPRPFGFESDRVTVRASEADLVREAAGRVLAGETLRGICADWTVRGIPTVTGAQWRTPILRQILMSPRAAGLRVLDGRTSTAVWPGLIDPDTHLRLVALLSDPSRVVNRTRGVYLLTGGLAVCGKCGHKLVAKPGSNGRRGYTCTSAPGFNGCGGVFVLAEGFEAEVERRALAVIGSTLPPIEQPAEPVADAIDELEERRTQLAADHYATGLIDRAQFLAATAALDARLADLRTRIVRDVHVDRHRAVLAAPGLADRWPSMTVDARRAVLDALIEAVEVHPAARGLNRFDPKRVEVRWR